MKWRSVLVVVFVFCVLDDHLVLGHNLATTSAATKRAKLTPLSAELMSASKAHGHALKARLLSRIASFEGSEPTQNPPESSEGGNTADKPAATEGDDAEEIARADDEAVKKVLDGASGIIQTILPSTDDVEFPEHTTDLNPHDVWIGPIHVATFRGKPFCPVDANGQIIANCQIIAGDLKVLSMLFVMSGFSTFSYWLSRRLHFMYSVPGQSDPFGLSFLSYFLWLLAAVAFAVSESLLQGFYGFFIFIIWVVKFLDLVLSRIIGSVVKRKDMTSLSVDHSNDSKSFVPEGSRQDLLAAQLADLKPKDLEIEHSDDTGSSVVTTPEDSAFATSPPVGSTQSQ